MNINLYINKLANQLFVQKEVDIKDPQVVAAIITAAGEMAKYSNIVSTEDTTQVLLKIYDANGLSEVEMLIGALGPQFVKTIIGFPVDFENKAQAQMAYIASEEKYNDLYQSIKVQYLLNEQRRF